MNIILHDYEKIVSDKKKSKKKMKDEEINQKYESGEHRIVTEQGAFKLDLIQSIFSNNKYNLQPDFQRRITWDEKKRSKLIESFIMNIPIPPVFLYEENYSSYVVMDGLQRISTIIEFYGDKFALTGLEEWEELNGKTYSQLPDKIQEGIDRRQLSVITLLKESTEDAYSADRMKKLVFERLNTGGITLEDQEIRNALYAGKFNDLCFKLSENTVFKKLWNLENISGRETVDNHNLDENDTLMAAKNRMYRRMYDVELVLRYFAMRNVDSYSGKLSKYLDNYLEHANRYENEQMEEMENTFCNVIKKAYSLFGEKAFCFYREEKWSMPQNMIYDAMMLALSDEQVGKTKMNQNIESNLGKLADFYRVNAEKFNGKKQSKTDIIERADLFIDLIRNGLE